MECGTDPQGSGAHLISKEMNGINRNEKVRVCASELQGSIGSDYVRVRASELPSINRNEKVRVCASELQGSIGSDYVRVCASKLQGSIAGD